MEKKEATKPRVPKVNPVVAYRPVWKGPEVDGITFSLLSRFLVCRERFRLLVVEGLRPVPTFSHRIEYGQMWHVCEEAYAANETWEPVLKRYCAGLAKKYPLAREQIALWSNVCRRQFPAYLGYWREQKVKKRSATKAVLLQEHAFDVRYALFQGRSQHTVRLRGRWDRVDLFSSGKGAEVSLWEHKTKGKIDQGQLSRQLQFDLQTMLYLVALTTWQQDDAETFPVEGKYPITRVQYNVVRRPLSGGKHTIRQCQKESEQAFYSRLEGLIRDDPEYFFMRWEVTVTAEDIERFRHECLDPLLLNLCRWWESISDVKYPFGAISNSLHWRTPYGFYNILAEGGSSELDEYLATGSELGLERTDKLFEEIE